MILTESKIKEIIVEELENLLSEKQLDEGLKEKVKELIKKGFAPAVAIAMASAFFAGGEKAGDDTGVSRHNVSGQVAKAYQQDDDSVKNHRPKPKSFGTSQNKQQRKDIKTNINVMQSPLDKINAFKNSKISKEIKTKLKAYYELSGNDPKLFDAIQLALEQANNPKYKVITDENGNIIGNQKDAQIFSVMEAELGMDNKYVKSIGNYLGMYGKKNK